MDCTGRDGKELGLSQDGKPVITDEQIEELKAHAEDINYDVAKERENWYVMTL